MVPNEYTCPITVCPGGIYEYSCGRFAAIGHYVNRKLCGGK